MAPPARSLVALIAPLAGCTFIYDTGDLPPLPSRWAPPVAITQSAQLERAPALTADGSSVYFNLPADGRADLDIWRRDRTSTGWSEPHAVGVFSSEIEDDRAPHLTASGGQLFFTRPVAEHGLDVFAAARTGDDWSPAAPVDRFNTSSDEDGGAPCDEGATMFVIRHSLTISVEEDTGDDALWVDLGGLVTPQTLSASPDCLRLYVAARGTAEDLDLFVLRRPSRGAPWSPPERLDGLCTDADERAPSATADGAAIVFERGDDLWESHLIAD